MKAKNRNRIIVIVVIAAILLYISLNYYILKNKKKTINMSLPFRKIFEKIKNRYGKEISEFTEKIARFETNHFRSGGWMKAFNQGMLAHTKQQPYGFTYTLEQFWKDYPQYAPLGYTTLTGYDDEEHDYLEFDTAQASLMSLANYLYMRDNPYHYYSKIEGDESIPHSGWKWYQKVVNDIKPTYNEK